MNIVDAYLNIIGGGEQTNKRPVLKASELISLLQKKIDEYGDLEISINTQEGSSYSLYGEDCVQLMTGTKPDGSEIQWIEIG